jgi:hypothetical protein
MRKIKSEANNDTLFLASPVVPASSIIEQIGYLLDDLSRGKRNLSCRIAVPR